MPPKLKIFIIVLMWTILLSLLAISEQRINSLLRYCLHLHHLLTFAWQFPPNKLLNPYFKTLLLSKISKCWYWKSAIYRNSYRNIDIKNIEPQNHIKAKSLKFHIILSKKIVVIGVLGYVWDQVWPSFCSLRNHSSLKVTCSTFAQAADLYGLHNTETQPSFVSALPPDPFCLHFSCSPSTIQSTVCLRCEQSRGS